MPRRGSRFLRIAGWTLFGVVMAVAFAFVFGLVVKWLWNWLMPAIFGLGVISYWQAFGIVLLVKLLFGGFGSRSHDHKDRFSHPWHDHRPRFMSDFRSKDWSHQKERQYARHYRDFWQNEGKKAFEEYIRRAEEKKDIESEGK